jgi:hypothetical protein
MHCVVILNIKPASASSPHPGFAGPFPQGEVIFLLDSFAQIFLTFQDIMDFFLFAEVAGVPAAEASYEALPPRAGDPARPSRKRRLQASDLKLQKKKYPGSAIEIKKASGFRPRAF